MSATRYRRDVRVAVIGAGLGGVATAVKMRRAGIRSLTVFERAAGPGGVWWQNTYPGCEVDVPSLAYSFSFAPYRWSRSHADREEIQRYVEHIIDRFGVRDCFRFATPVARITWDERDCSYRLSSGDGSDLGQFDLVVSCVGMLSDPNIPNWPGLDTFAGPVFHTSRYEHQHNLTGKRVALVGTGSTAAQLGPAIAPQVGYLDLYQREPGYVLPKSVTTYTAAERARHLRMPLLRKVRRYALFREASKLSDALRAGSVRQQHVRSYCLASLEKIISDAETRSALTPKYPYGCKRPVIASDYYPMLNRENVTLVPHAVQRVTPRGIVDDTGTERPADVLILGTGFKAADYLASVEVIGRGGESLHEHWDGEPSAFLGMTVPGFPNFLMVYGPNTNGGWSVIAQLEPQAALAARVARRLARRKRNVVDTRPMALTRYDAWVQSGIRSKLSALAGGCHNYYTSVTGKNVTQWPHGHPLYRAVLRLLPRWGLTWSNGRCTGGAEPHEIDDVSMSITGSGA